jgi:hypothetical protein
MKAECMQLAGDAATPELQRHFLDQADVWAGMAERGPTETIVPPTGPDSSD